jgi:hypothetical protein
MRTEPPFVREEIEMTKYRGLGLVYLAFCGVFVGLLICLRPAKSGEGAAPVAGSEDPQAKEPHKALASASRMNKSGNASKIAQENDHPLIRVTPVGSEDLDNVQNLGLPEELVHFKMIVTKVLTTREDRETLARTLASPVALRHAVATLAAYNPQEQMAIARRRRMVAIDYIAYLAEKGTPEMRDKALEEAQHLALAGLPQLPLSVSAKKTLLGDKIELLGMIRHFSPDRFERMREKSRGTPAEKIVEYVHLLWNKG